MAHDVFISHSTKDKAVSDAVCAALENAGLRCWIAPRDVQPGRSFAGEINRAIQHSKVMVLIFSAHSNNSEQVLREVQLGVNSHLHIIQFRIEDVRLNDDLEYFLSTPHWLDALTAPLENHLERLRTSIQALLGAPAEQSITTAPSTGTHSAVSIPQRLGSVSSPFEKRDVPASVSQSQQVSVAGQVPRPLMNRGRQPGFAAALVALLAAATLGGWWLGVHQPRRERERLGVQQRAQEEAKKEAIATATKVPPFENSLGMKFVPVPGIKVLFSIWETRVKDFEAFVKATGHKAEQAKQGPLDVEGGVWSIDKERYGGWTQAGKTWRDPGFAQTGDHPVCGVDWEDATAFCEWLTKQEHNTGRISAGQSYRLPTDLEWSAAVGLERESGNTPEERNQKATGIYPWGSKFPPPDGAGNYAGSEARTGAWPSDWETIQGYRDGYPCTSPAGSFAANELRICDLGGNVWEWCEDWYDAKKKYRVLRGASWGKFYQPGTLLSSCRDISRSGSRFVTNGFRCVLVLESSR